MTFHRVNEASAALGSLDHPEKVPSGTNGLHVFTEDQIPWLRIEDDLPRYEQFGPGREEETNTWPKMGDNPTHREQK